VGQSRRGPVQLTVSEGAASRDGKVALLQHDPTRYGTYSKKVDTYVTDFDYGVIMYAVVKTT
jgi:hypothetical protein